MLKTLMSVITKMKMKTTKNKQKIGNILHNLCYKNSNLCRPVEYTEVLLPGTGGGASAAPMDQIKEEGRTEVKGSPGKYAQLEQLRKEQEKEQDGSAHSIIARDGHSS